MLTIQAKKKDSIFNQIKNNKGKIAFISTFTTFSALLLAINPAKANNYEYLMNNCLGLGLSIAICLEDVPMMMCMDDGHSLRKCEKMLNKLSPASRTSHSLN